MAMKRKNLPELVPQVFEHEYFGSVRVVIIDGKPWFVGIDVARALGYKNGSRDINRHVDPEDRIPEVPIRYLSSKGVTQNRKVTVINKSGVYSLILDSQLPKAKEFRHWVTSEVLPQIDETGSYSVPKPKKKELPPLPPSLLNDDPSDFGNLARLELFLEKHGIEYDYELAPKVIHDENGKTSLSYCFELVIKADSL